jgi:hypothetical protein
LLLRQALWADADKTGIGAEGMVELPELSP